MERKDGESKLVIAIVDDDEGIRASLCNFLLSADYECSTYSSGEEFLESAAFLNADCAIVDINLRGITGIELAQKIRRTHVTLPLIFMSGRWYDPNYLRLEALEIQAFLIKPVQSDDLILNIQLGIARHK